MSLSVEDASLLAQSWQLALRAERKSPQTVKGYGDGVRLYLDWCAASRTVRDSINAAPAYVAPVAALEGVSHGVDGEEPSVAAAARALFVGLAVWIGLQDVVVPAEDAPDGFRHDVSHDVSRRREEPASVPTLLRSRSAVNGVPGDRGTLEDASGGQEDFGSVYPLWRVVVEACDAASG